MKILKDMIQQFKEKLKTRAFSAFRKLQLMKSIARCSGAVLIRNQENGPNGSSKEEWGVNYRALNDLFLISQNGRNTIMYEIGVQIVEIHNELVRDLLSNNANQKKYPSVDL